AFGELVENRDVFGDANRVGGRKHDRHRRERDALGARRKVRIEQHRVDRDLAAFGMKVVLGRRERIDAELIGENDELPQLVEHHLVALGAATDRTKLRPFFVRGGDGGHREEVELQVGLLSAGGAARPVAAGRSGANPAPASDFRSGLKRVLQARRGQFQRRRHRRGDQAPEYGLPNGAYGSPGISTSSIIVPSGSVRKTSRELYSG